jgi:hypothetical protein
MRGSFLLELSYSTIASLTRILLIKFDYNQSELVIKIFVNSAGYGSVDRMQLM